MSVLGVELQTRVRKMDMPASYQKTRMIVPTVFGPMMLVSEHFIDTSWPFLLDGCALVSEGGW
jgi:hypothetical protein